MLACVHILQVVYYALYERCTHADSSTVLAGTNACFFNTAVQVLRATPGLVEKLEGVPWLSTEAAKDRPRSLAPAFLKLANEVCKGWATGHGLLVLCTVCECVPSATK